MTRDELLALAVEAETRRAEFFADDRGPTDDYVRDAVAKAVAMHDFAMAALAALPELLRRLDLADQALATLVAGLQEPGWFAGVQEPGWCWHCGHRPGHREHCPVADAGRALTSIRAPLDQPQETP